MIKLYLPDSSGQTIEVAQVEKLEFDHQTVDAIIRSSPVETVLTARTGQTGIIFAHGFQTLMDWSIPTHPNKISEVEGLLAAVIHMMGGAVTVSQQGYVAGLRKKVTGRMTVDPKVGTYTLEDK